MRNTLSLLATLSTLLIATNSFAGNTSFNDPQKKQIEQIIENYILENPEIIQKANEKLRKKEFELRKERRQKAIKDNQQEIFKNTQFTFGNPNAQVTLVHFFDYNCRYCKKMKDSISEIVQENSNIKVQFIDLPIMGQSSEYAAKAALAANLQGKYLELHYQFMSYSSKLSQAKVLELAEKVGLDINQLKADMNKLEITAQIENNKALGRKIGLTGTPAIILGKNATQDNFAFKFVPGAVSKSILLNYAKKL